MTRVQRDSGKPVRRRTRGPSPHKTAETRRLLAEAALELFLERGFRATRISDVADRAGLAKGTVYLHFADKRALFAGVVGEVLDRPLAALSAAEPAEGEPVRAFLSRTVTPLLTTIETSRWAGLARLIVAEGADAPEIADIYRQRVLGPFTEKVRQWAAIAAQRGEVTGDAMQRFPMLLMAPAVLATLWNGMFGGEEPMSAASMFEGFLDLVFEQAAS